MKAPTELSANGGAVRRSWVPGPATVPPAAEVVGDVLLAMRLTADGARATGPAAEALRVRMRGYLRELTGPAEIYATTLTDPRQRDFITDRINFAQRLAVTPHTDPRHDLRLLAKSANPLVRYARRADERAPGALRLPPCELARDPSGIYDLDVTHSLCPGIAPTAPGALPQERECPCHAAPSS